MECHNDDSIDRVKDDDATLFCYISLRTRSFCFSAVTVVTGNSLPLWDTLYTLVSKNYDKVKVSERSLPVVRSELDDGTTIMGIQFPTVLAPHLKVMQCIDVVKRWKLLS